MARFIYGLNQSLDGYVDHMALRPDAVLFRHFIEEVRGTAGLLYGRRMYETMRYWDEDREEWGTAEREYASVWRSKTKWVVSEKLSSAGPNVCLIRGNLETAVRNLKDRHDGVIEVAGPTLAHALTEMDLIDEYRIYLHPVVLGEGRPFFRGPRPPLRLAGSERIGSEVIRLTYVPI